MSECLAGGLGERRGMLCKCCLYRIYIVIFLVIATYKKKRDIFGEFKETYNISVQINRVKTISITSISPSKHYSPTTNPTIKKEPEENKTPILHLHPRRRQPGIPIASPLHTYTRTHTTLPLYALLYVRTLVVFLLYTRRRRRLRILTRGPRN